MTCEPKDLRDLPLVRLLDVAFEGVGLAVPAPWRLVYANQALADLTGALPAELVGRQVEELVRGTSSRSLSHVLNAALSGEQTEDTLSAELLVHEETKIPVRIRCVRLVLNDEPTIGMLIQKAADAQRMIETIPAERRDPLTALPDRAFLLARLDSLQAGASPSNRCFAVLFVDLDNFKHVNDAHGHLVGDGVIREVARRLNACVRDEDCVVRYGGDEFVVIVERVDGPEDVAPVIHRLQSALREPIPLPNGKVELSASIGTAFATPDCRTPEELLAAADRDMYASKRERER